MKAGALALVAALVAAAGGASPSNASPRDDVNRITCITAGRLIVNLSGMAVRAGYFDR